ncbi:GNAT family N-acetyltransferase [Brachybacterium fresconis]|uniref:Acetyltransferase n=1 Tax=Brachybacterium fresconis TaxID=173363 RepID=A0ABS4YL34_9MICO|nr:GNAT family N-acetyltransferase [Brachybacterium fresconis]MBP2409510.1 putative acetyltransferase [Brachybacterium fresconis]
MTSAGAPLTPTVTVVTDAGFDLLGRLLQLYLYDFSEHAGYDVDERGEYHYAWLDAYRDEADRHAYLFRVGAHPAGFALVRRGEPTTMAEFFVLRKYRRGGVGTTAARQLLAMLPGTWSISQLASNRAATEFWRRAIPVPFEEITHADGHMEQRFTSPRPQRPAGHR